MKMFVIVVAAVAIAAPAFAQTGFTQAQHPPGQQGQWGGQGQGQGHGPEGPEGPRDHDRMFAMMDTNHDGVVSKAEFEAFHARMRGMHRGEHGEHGPGGPRGEGPPPGGQ